MLYIPKFTKIIYFPLVFCKNLNAYGKLVALVPKLA